MIPAAEFKAAVQEMLDALGDGLVDADTIKARFDAMLDAVPIEAKAAHGGAVPGSLAHPSYRFDDPFAPAHDGPWDAEKGEWEPRD